MTDTPNAPSGDLSSLKVAQLQQIAAELGIKGARRMRKSDLIDALRAGEQKPAGGSGPAADQRSDAGRRGARGQQGQQDAGTADQGRPGAAETDQGPQRESDPQGQLDLPGQQERPQPDRQDPRGQKGRQGQGQDKPDQDKKAQQGRSGQRDQGGQQRGGKPEARSGQDSQRNRQDPKGGRQRGGDQGGQSDKAGGGDRRRPSVDDIQLPEPRALESEGDQRRPGRGQGAPDKQDGDSPRSDDGDRNNRRRRGRERSRDRKRRGGRGHDDLAYEDIELSPDDVLIPIAGILDILDNYAFVRTSGYLPGANDVYVSLNQVKKHGLRRGDAIVGAVRQPREGEQTNQRQKFNALVRLDTVNGAPAEEAQDRPEFASLTALYPQERLSLETKASEFSTRIVDLFMPVGKGQRGLILAPPKTGKTRILQQIANAVTTNNPEAHLMVVLVDERPEEVTDMQRTVKGEVISSTFDRPATDHTVVAELAIERAKRLVELGQDVVVLLDSLTRLARAYNLAAPASGRVLSGGVDASALYPPKRFFGAARNIEHGGSLTILASASVESGSTMDEVILEEFKGTPNSELRLSRELADKRIFPAVDVHNSSTRREDLLVSESELQTMWKLRRSIAELDPQQAIEHVLTTMRGTGTRAEFLTSVNKAR